jgi:DNA-directed RNA polymerase subunit K/omega
MTTETSDHEVKPQENPQDETEKQPERTDFLGEDFEELADNIYEAIIVIAKRARSIGESQKREIDSQIGTLELTETPEDDLFEDEETEPEFRIYEKPTILAMQEMKSGQLKYEYQE